MLCFEHMIKSLHPPAAAYSEVIDNPGMLDKCDLWDTAFPDAFKWAHEADPDAKLCLNDQGLIEGSNAPNLIMMIKNHLWANGAPIHCIGMQAHFEYYGINITNQRRNLDLLATLGLDLYISEFTLFSTWNGGPTPEHPSGWPASYLDEDTQADMITSLFRFWFNHPALKGLFMWGFWDKNIWIDNCGVFREDKSPKKAALAIQTLWQQKLTTRINMEQPAAVTAFTGYYGQYQYQFVTQAGAVARGAVQFSRHGARQQSLGGVL